MSLPEGPKDLNIWQMNDCQTQDETIRFGNTRTLSGKFIGSARDELKSGEPFARKWLSSINHKIKIRT